MTSSGRLGILVGGGPAPGINSAISSATIEAVNSGLQVTGIYDGFQNLMDGALDMVRPLTIQDVSRVHSQGGSILRTSRANPTSSKDGLARTIDSLRRLGVTYLVTIGGEDTASSAARVGVEAGGGVRVAHVPKTIDNDLPLPSGLSTFGFQTARHVGTEQVLNLMEEARTSNRWVFVVVMGRNAGHLALGIGKAAGATLTIIPEEFQADHITLDDVVTVLEGAMWKRLAGGQSYGVAVISEGIVGRMRPEDIEAIPGADVAYDAHGHLRLGEIPIGAMLRREVSGRFAARNRRCHITDVTLGYTLRCAPPIPFDVDYTRTLGYGAVRFLLSEPSDPELRTGGMVCSVEGHSRVIPFSEIVDPSTGRMAPRLVDTTSEHFKVSWGYMIRLQPEDLEDREKLEVLASTAGISPDEFRESFAPAVRSG